MAELTSTHTGHVRLLVLETQRRGLAAPLVLRPGKYVLGTGLDAQLRLDANGVQPRHALIVVGERQTVVKALDPRTWVNDSPINETLLRQGDVLTIGPISLRVRAATVDESRPTVTPLEQFFAVPTQREEAVRTATVPTTVPPAVPVPRPAPVTLAVTPPYPLPPGDAKPATPGVGGASVDATLDVLTAALDQLTFTPRQPAELRRAAEAVQEHREAKPVVPPPAMPVADVPPPVRETAATAPLLAAERMPLEQERQELLAREAELRRRTTALDAQSNVLAAREAKIAERDALGKAQLQRLETHERDLAQQQSEIAQRQQAAALEQQRQEAAWHERAQLLERRTEEFQLRQAQLEREAAELAQRRQQLDAEHQARLAATEAEGLRLKAALREQAANLRSEVVRQHEESEQRTGELNRLAEAHRQEQARLASWQAALQTTANSLNDARTQFDAREHMLSSQALASSTRQQRLDELEQELEQQRAQLGERESRLAQREVQLDQQEETILSQRATLERSLATAERERVALTERQAEQSRLQAEFQTQQDVWNTAKAAREAELLEASRTWQHQQDVLAGREQQLVARELDVQEQAARAAQAVHEIEQRAHELDAREQRVAEERSRLERREIELAEAAARGNDLQAGWQAREQELTQQAEQLAQQGQQGAERQRAADARQAELDAREREVAQRLYEVAEREAAMTTRSRSLEEAERAQSELANSLSEKKSRLEQWEHDLRREEAGLNAQFDQVQQAQASQMALASLADRESSLNMLTSQLEGRDTTLAERERALAELQAGLEAEQFEMRQRAQDVEALRAEIASQQEQLQAQLNDALAQTRVAEERASRLADWEALLQRDQAQLDARDRDLAEARERLELREQQATEREVDLAEQARHGARAAVQAELDAAMAARENAVAEREQQLHQQEQAHALEQQRLGYWRDDLSEQRAALEIREANLASAETEHRRSQEVAVSAPAVAEHVMAASLPSSEELASGWAQLDKERASLADEMASFLAEREAEKREADALRTRLVELEQQMQAEHEHVVQLRNALDDERQRHAPTLAAETVPAIEPVTVESDDGDSMADGGWDASAGAGAFDSGTFAEPTTSSEPILPASGRSSEPRAPQTPATNQWPFLGDEPTTPEQYWPRGRTGSGDSPESMVVATADDAAIVSPTTEAVARVNDSVDEILQETTWAATKVVEAPMCLQGFEAAEYQDDVQTAEEDPLAIAESLLAAEQSLVSGLPDVDDIASHYAKTPMPPVANFFNAPLVPPPIEPSVAPEDAAAAAAAAADAHAAEPEVAGEADVLSQSVETTSEIEETPPSVLVDHLDESETELPAWYRNGDAMAAVDVESDETPEVKDGDSLRAELARLFNLPANSPTSAVDPLDEIDLTEGEVAEAEGLAEIDRVEEPSEALEAVEEASTEETATSDAAPTMSLSLSATLAKFAARGTAPAASLGDLLRKVESPTIEREPEPEPEPEEAEAPPSLETTVGVPEVPATAEVTEPAANVEEEDDSIAAYMERLLGRTRGEPVVEKSATSSTVKAEVVVPEVSREELLASTFAPVRDDREISDAPRSQVDKDAVREGMNAFRKVANESARSAISASAWQRMRANLYIKVGLSLLASGACVAFYAAPWWGERSYSLQGAVAGIAAGLAWLETYRTYCDILILSRRGTVGVAKAAKVKPSVEAVAAE